MVCYVIPLIASLVGTLRRMSLKRRHPKNSYTHSFWLNIMLLGGALFGVIDHLWHGELFLIGQNWMFDLALGSTITAGIIGSWGVIVYKNDIVKVLDSMVGYTGMYRERHELILSKK